MERLKYLVLINQKIVLDSGCGKGQWSSTISQLNENIHTVDISIHRIFIAKKLAQNNHAKNIDFLYSSIENLPFPNNYFIDIKITNTYYFSHNISYPDSIPKCSFGKKDLTFFIFVKLIKPSPSHIIF
ncbi:hypothetical protein DID75_00300 [Candidatus Marinamargulisbacteria bacterium SCGC AG-410-N11]|nr:hypothetical protein DID75_00300 [Candidatus Marinamargulisbacteria bacterium SCGC AG-410-N11]